MMYKIIVPIVAIKLDIKEPNETIFEIRKVTKKVIITRTKSRGQYPKIRPQLVATAFPPLNFKNTEKVCPSTANSPQIAGEISIYVEDIISNLKRNVNNAPFRKSQKKAIIAYFFPKTLPVFVAPIFLLPCSLMSIPFDFPNIYPNGIAPIK